MNNKKALIQQLEKGELNVNLISELFNILKNDTPWVLRYLYNRLKTGKGYNPSDREVEIAVKEAIKLLRK